MGLRLDWHVEADDGWAQIGEDAEILARRTRRQRRIRYGLLIGLVALLVIGTFVTLRLGAVGRQRRADLEALVAAETLALRIGDRGAYLQAQSLESAWKHYQSDTFDQYRALGSRLTVAGEIAQVGVDANRARVILRETLDGRPYQVTWFYLHDGQVWRHVPSRPEFWGKPQHLEATAYRLTYYQADQVYAERLAGRLAAMQDMLSAAGIPLSPERRAQIYIDPDPFAPPGWQASDGSLHLVSPQLDRLLANGSPDPAWLFETERLVDDAWIVMATGTYNRPFAESYLRDQLELWLAYEAGADVEPPLLIASLIQATGPQVITMLLLELADGDPPPEALDAVMRRASSGGPPAAQELTGLLQMESALDRARWEPGFSYADMQLIDIFQDPERPYNDWNRLRVMRWSVTETIQVVDVHYSSYQLIWAETRFRSMRPETFNREVMMLIPFRNPGWGWYRSAVDERDFEEQFAITGEQVTLTSSEIDGPFGETILDSLERAYAAAIHDFDIQQPPPVRAVLAYSREEWQASTSPSRPISRSSIRVILPSPHLPGYLYLPAPALERQIGGMAADHLLREVLAYLSGERTQPVMAEAIVAWELARLGYDADAIPYGRNCLTGAEDPSDITLDDLWVGVLPVWSQGRFADPGEVCTRALAADALLAVLIERHGETIMPALVAGLGDAAGLQDWLAVLNITPGDIEAAWRAELIARFEAAH